MSKEIPISDWVLGTKVIRAYLLELREDILRDDDLKKFILQHEYDFHILSDRDKPELDSGFVKEFYKRMLSSDVVGKSKVVRVSEGGYNFFIKNPREALIHDDMARDFFISEEAFQEFIQNIESMDDLNNLGKIVIQRLKDSYDYLPLKRSLNSALAPTVDKAPAPNDSDDGVCGQSEICKKLKKIPPGLDFIYYVGEPGCPPVDALEELGFEKYATTSIEDGGRRVFYQVNISNEGGEHNNLKHQFYKYGFKKWGIKAKLNGNDRADIEYSGGGKEYGLEILTPSYLDNQKKLDEKITRYNDFYDFWFIVASNRDLIRKFGGEYNGIKLLLRGEALVQLPDLFHL
jgi:hypothetical protein